ncbi:hypothetical protein C1637_13555 [Chryseobacterium lactis]|uniref:T9SS C-terminal target domain-containing protein n=1 Tax=Chryseobacterium lactis TaxID=1241981 RepID=A0A3G6RK19_CHRLC|nr:T9SS type A sorting domain-containing protein [Chryseobacterium lactis]AZA83848.1 T9SS C-terminal target domain-containing protein [Chryseobacterium lactis]AZB04233.1 T9SS C-terminal target domain-containing protein [Chryseobacterium lactis]PNW12859.1 hypothetical protein C1637_13555 [Chryseobacterium lactis]
MKKTLFSTLLLSAALQFNAQTTIFEETFDSTPDYSLPSGWNNNSLNDTLWKWYCQPGSLGTNAMGFSGKIASVGKYNTTDDQSLVTPVITLSSGNSYLLTFLIGALGAEQRYAVYVLPAGNTFTGSETPVFEETISQERIALSQSIDLSEYAGQDIKVYFRTFGLNRVNSSAGYYLDNVRITQQPQLATSEVFLKSSGVGVYPNPTADYVYLKSPSKITKAEVFDSSGRKMNTSLNDNKIDIRNLLPGAYVVKMTTDRGSYSQKVIKK